MILGTFGGGQIVVLLIFLLLIVFIIWRTIKYFSKKAKEGKLKQSLLITLGVFILILIGLTLPFHYVPSKGEIFTKESMSFSNTFISQKDIDDLIKRYNSANFFERQAINQEPLMRKLKEKGIIVDLDNSNSDY